SQYAIELLKKHGLNECVSMSTPMATERLSRPDISFATFVCARYQARPTVKHLKEVKRIFRHLRQSYKTGLWYPMESGFELISYSDADHAGCKDDCKRTLGGLQFLVIWMRTQLLDYGYKYNRIPMYCDSKSAIAISCNPVQHSKTKHIDIRYHFIKEHVEKGTVEIYFVGTEYELADLFTKTLPKERFNYLVHRIVIWMRTQLLDYGYKYNRIPMYCDSKSAIAISCNLVQHSKTKHIDIRYHFIKEHVEKGTVEIYFVGTVYQLADLFTKALPKERFEYLVHCIGMRYVWSYLS
ncbi:hypothetical protein Tco_1535725, partial [Tanacetum coccineum]